MIQEVTDRRSEKEFLDFPRRLYKNDPYWVCVPDKDIKKIFNPAENKNFIGGEAARWILKNESGETLGRIAAFYNMKKARAEKVLTGGIGFFECINDQPSANQLFDKAKEWLAARGMKAMDGPVNFGENDSHWGLLADGFMHPGIGMPYHLPYYKDLFFSYGFEIFFKQFSFHLDLTKKFPERFWKIAEWIGKKPDFHFKHFSFKNSEKFIDDAAYIYEKAWSVLKEDFTPLDKDLLRATMNGAKAIIDEEMIWFAYHKDEPVSFFIMFPDANQILRKLNGKLHLINMLRFLYYKKIKTITRIRAIAAGVIPKFQNSGVESGIFWHMNEKMKFKPQYKEIELSWVGDFNPKMISLYEAVGGVKAKTHYTMRYMIDKNIEFERFMPEKVNPEKLKEIGAED
ncbi:MAG: GNAT family N-acetyltransferase [Bacteroidales bacterium]|nr:GNAT family N-acetyltransferase [Bacteroidales bacterium]